MKLLIAITSCARDRDAQQAQRDTWIKDIPAGVDYRFFLGNPKPAYDVQPDEVFLDVPDDYVSLPLKTKGLLSWATDRGYDFIYKTDVDTLVCPYNLLHSGFEKHSYTGGMLICPDLTFASGGSGYWLDAKTARIVLSYPGEDTTCEDVMVGKACRDNGIPLCGHPQYKFLPGSFLTKGTISYHLSSVYGWRQDGKTEPYTPALMYDAYAKTKSFTDGIDFGDWKGSQML